MRSLCLLLAAPLLAQARPEPGADPRLRARLQPRLAFDATAAWRSFVEEGMPSAVVEVVAQLTEAERHEQALEETLALLRLQLHEMWGQFGTAASRDHRPALLGDSPAKVYPLGRPLKP